LGLARGEEREQVRRREGELPVEGLRIPTEPAALGDEVLLDRVLERELGVRAGHQVGSCPRPDMTRAVSCSKRAKASRRRSGAYDSMWCGSRRWALSTWNFL